MKKDSSTEQVTLNTEIARNAVEMKEYYKEDLAYIHDVGFSDYCLKSAPGILEILQKSNINTGLVAMRLANKFAASHYTPIVRN